MATNKHWLDGPKFLLKDQSEWPEQPVSFSVTNGIDDQVYVNVTMVDESKTEVKKLLHYFSDWVLLKKAVAVFLRVKKILQQRAASKRSQEHVTSCDAIKKLKGPLSVQEMIDAETSILQFSQNQHFKEDIDNLTSAEDSLQEVSAKISRHSPVYRLDPYLANGLLRVGGRLRRANIPEHMKHPVLISHKSHITEMIIRDIHVQLGHAGRNHVLAKLRESYWITKANATVRHVISHCVKCRRFRGSLGEQKMADLPVDRMTEAPVFTYTGVDYFGPYLVKEGRKQLKRYGVLFTCLVSRAIHIETANSLDTDSFIQALRRFIARRGNVRELRSDNGTNFVGAERELFQSLDHSKIRHDMLNKHIDWKFNPPAASHMGGVWERLIKSVKKVLSPMLTEYGDRLDDESLRTLFCEVEAIVNSRPLTTVSSDPNDMDALTPSHLLTMKTAVITPPPGEFQRSDIYLKRRWRRVQYLCNLFWSRWKREYLLTLQTRQKWNQPKRNIQVGDVVLVMDENSPRNIWSMGRVVTTQEDTKGFVRSVTLKTQSSELRRPVTKLVLMLPVEEQI